MRIAWMLWGLWALLCLASVSKADTVVVNTTNSQLQASVGSTVTFYGTVTNDNSDEIFSSPILNNNVQAGYCCGPDATGFIFDTVSFDVLPLTTSSLLPLFTLTVAPTATVGDEIAGQYRAVFWDEYNTGTGQVGINNYFYPQFANWQITVLPPSQSVPEPSSFVLITLGLVATCFKKRLGTPGLS
jgi:hypothetical protein